MRKKIYALSFIVLLIGVLLLWTNLRNSSLSATTTVQNCDILSSAVKELVLSEQERIDVMQKRAREEELRADPLIVVRNKILPHVRPMTINDYEKWLCGYLEQDKNLQTGIKSIFYPWTAQSTYRLQKSENLASNFYIEIWNNYFSNKDDYLGYNLTTYSYKSPEYEQIVLSPNATEKNL